MPISSATIITEFFRLYTYPQLIALANSNLELADVVGQILSVQGSNLDDSKSKQKIVLLLLLQKQTTVRITIWDEQAAVFCQLFNIANRKSNVMVFTCLNPKMFAGTLYLNSTGATKFYMDTKMIAIKSYMKTMGIEDNHGCPTIDVNCLTSIHLETWALKKMLQYITQGNHEEKEIICTAKIVGISAKNGWNYVSCSKCSKKLGRSQNSLVCNVCVNGNAIGIVKFRVELLVDDGSAQSKFVIFDRDARKLTNKTAEDLNASEGIKKTIDVPCQQIPICISELVGKTMEFQVKITKYNFTVSFQTFTVTRVIREIQAKGNGHDQATISAQDEEPNVRNGGNRDIKTEDGTIPPTFAVAEESKAKKSRTA